MPNFLSTIRLNRGKKDPPNYACKQRRGGFDVEILPNKGTNVKPFQKREHNGYSHHLRLRRVVQGFLISALPAAVSNDGGICF